MKGLFYTHKGFEDIAALEIKELISKEATTQDYVALFDADEEALAKLAYQAQSARKILLLIGKGNTKSLGKDAKKMIDAFDFSKYLDKKKSFRVITKKETDDVSAQEISADIGELIIKKTKAKAVMETQDIIIYCIVTENQFYIGIDFAGFELDKRYYKLFTMAGSVKGTLAYATARAVGLDDKTKAILDPFAGTGMMPIEAALFLSKKSPHYYNKEKFSFRRMHFFRENLFEDWDAEITETTTKIYGYDILLPSLKNCQKNAKLAGIEKLCDFSKIEISWLDTKFDRETVDLVVGQPPELSKFAPEKKVKKTYKDVFYQLDFILTKKGRAGFLVASEKSKEALLEYAKTYKFQLLEERIVYGGRSKYALLIFRRG